MIPMHRIPLADMFSRRATTAPRPDTAEWPARLLDEHYRIDASGPTLTATLALPCARCFAGQRIVKHHAHGLEYTDLEPCRCAEGLHRAERFGRAHIPSAMEATTRAAFDWSRVDASQPVRNALGLAARGVQGVLLHGPCGSGKTHLAVAALRMALLEHGRPGLFIRWPVLVADARTDARDGGEPPELDALRRKGQVVVLDELGGEKRTEFSIELLTRVLDAIADARGTLIATTNLPQDQLMEMGARVWSRLGMCTAVAVVAPDYRRT
jgi:DNA replication protein DnaC